jgi:FtsP/CotA-like multicopper oxidase with cupredoxin domain
LVECHCWPTKIGIAAISVNDMMMGRHGRAAWARRGPAINPAFDMDRIDLETRRGTLELWEIGSQMMAHPFHVHGTQFQILSLNGQVPPCICRAGSTVLVARHAQIWSRHRLAYAIIHSCSHCHILEHGMPV